MPSAERVLHHSPCLRLLMALGAPQVSGAVLHRVGEVAVQVHASSATRSGGVSVLCENGYGMLWQRGCAVAADMSVGKDTLSH